MENINVYRLDDKASRANSINVAGIQTRVNNSIISLNEFSSTSEKVFINIGNQLQQFLKSSRSIADNSSSVTSTISSGLLQSGINNLV